MTDFLFELFIIVVAVDVLTAMACRLKGKRAMFTLAVAVSALTALLAYASIDVDTESFEDLSLAAAFVFVALPLALIPLVGAVRLGKPTSWWVSRLSSPAARTRAVRRYEGAGAPNIE